ncbi:MAG TPA: hypothetical protein VEB70_06805 [Noviherbaspirillum sp.]|nr:hypothetical protein [Noviherbaspirillum sp.]
MDTPLSGLLTAEGFMPPGHCDLWTPGLDGIDFLGSLLAAGETIPAVALTVLARPEDSSRTAMAGYHAHVVEPIRLKELFDVISRLSRRQAG